MANTFKLNQKNLNNLANNLDQKKTISIDHHYEIKTMPKRFVKVKGNKKQAKVIGLVIIIVGVTAILGGAGYLLFTMFNSQQDDQNTNEVVANENANENENQNESWFGNDNQNQNENLNTNASNENENTNLNTNANTNTNVNANINVNANTNGNLNTNTPLFNVNTPLIAPPLGTDTDSDGLTDIEEALFGTNSKLPDTDGDSFLDGKEVARSYSPTEGEGKTLLDSNLIKVYRDSNYSYQVSYPSKWQRIVGIQEMISFRSNSGEMVQILVLENDELMSVKDWYLAIAPEVDPASLTETKISDFSAIQTPEGLNFYIAVNDLIIGFVYNYLEKPELQYQTTFEMMVASFDIIR